MKSKFKVLIYTLVILSLIFSVPLNSVYSMSNDDPAQIKLNQDLEYLGKLIQFIQAIYVDDVTEEELIEGAMKGVFLNLDEYSEYYTPEEFKELNENVSGEFGGVGLHIVERNGYITVIAPIEGSPAYRAGIKAGDRIVSVNNTDIVGLNVNEAADLMRGEPGTKVKLGVLREGIQEIIYFDIVREIIKVNPITYDVLDNNIGYIRISQFNSNTLENITEVLDEFDSKGIEKIIIDLRDNPGGFLNEVIDVLRLFVPEGPIVHVKKYDGTEEVYESYLKNPKYKLAVLVNGGSASASEIFAGAIQDRGVGTVIGTTTFGKGTVQSIYPLTNGGGVKITTAEYFTANKNKVNGVGIKPDIIVENTIGESMIDIDKLAYLDKMRKPTLGTVGLDVLVAEEILKVLGYNIENPDGILDVATFNVIKQFQKDRGLYGYGVLDYTTQDTLIEAAKEYTQSQIIDKQLEKAVEVLNAIEN